MYTKIAFTLVAFLAMQSLSTTFGVLAQSDDFEQNEAGAEANVSMDLSSLFPVVSMIKGQIKGVILDLISQVFQYIRAIAQEIKIRLIKKLGKYTLSDVFHLVFDGVIEFVNEETMLSTTTEYTTSTARTTTSTLAEEDSQEDKFQSEYNEIRRRYNQNPYSWSLYHK